MNEHNHHRIIEGFAASEKNINGAVGVPITNTLSESDKKILEDASDYTDDFIGASKIEAVGTQNRFFLFHFYYDIKCENGTIVLQRNNESDYCFHESMSRCDYDKEKYTEEKIDNSKLRSDSTTPPYTAIPNYKLFYTSINDREQYYANDLFKLENSNQSDCVAYLHAMRAKDESLSKAEEKFQEHLKNCFSEYLFIQNHEEALFMLGIAMHGIMDSFTPSHTHFQQYSNQHWGLHAQGDVIPINDSKEKFEFIPGQIDQENPVVKDFYHFIKEYNQSDIVSSTEFQMLRVFFLISDITDKETGYSYYENGGWSKLVDFWRTFEGNTLSQINDILSRGYKYGNNAYKYSKAAINTLEDVYEILVTERQKCLNNYDYYKNNKQSIVVAAVNKWRDRYIPFQSQYEMEIKLLESLFLKESVYKSGVREGLFAWVKGKVMDTLEDTLEESGKQQMALKYGGLNKI